MKNCETSIRVSGCLRWSVGLGLLLHAHLLLAETGVLRIQTGAGHSLIEGSSGFNVRIADKVWSYDHPDFRDAVKDIHPGWLRFFSGTMGDAFNSATGQYDLDYAWMFDDPAQYIKGYQYTEVKGPHRIWDLYQLLGEVGGRLVVTVNAFMETPEVVGELARFCKNNQIEVEVWQFCNEPYFYVPNRDRYWWNDGSDYVLKMKPYATAIRAVFPEAKLAPNYTWDGIWGFMKEIAAYQSTNGAYWDVFSKHSYAPHVGNEETWAQAYPRGNSKLLEATSPAAMSEIEEFTWKGIPMLITEFGVWNKALNGAYAAVYVSEYTLRQMRHPNLFLIGSHEVSNKVYPVKTYNQQILDAYNNGLPLDTRSLRTGYAFDPEGLGLKLVHEASNRSSHTWDVAIDPNPKVQGLNKKMVDGVYARAFRGNYGKDYLLVTNRSDQALEFALELDGKPLRESLEQRFIAGQNGNDKDLRIQTRSIAGASVLGIPGFSVSLFSWANQRLDPIPGSRIYCASVLPEGVLLKWWKREGAESYRVAVKAMEGDQTVSVVVPAAADAQTVLGGLVEGMRYEVRVSALKGGFESGQSRAIEVDYRKPGVPELFKVSRRNDTITAMWRSVSGASGYEVRFRNQVSGKEQIVPVGNVFGYREEGFPYDEAIEVSVRSLNGLGHSDFGAVTTLRCSRNLPIPARNVSAIGDRNGKILVKWIVQDEQPGTLYRVMRAQQLGDWMLLADAVSGSTWVDENPPEFGPVYYTVRTYNGDAVCDYLPNTATAIRSAPQLSLSIQSVQKQDTAYRIQVVAEGIPSGAETRLGVSLSDISYLTVEETSYSGGTVTPQGYFVDVPLSGLKAGREYAVKAVVEKSGVFYTSEPPHKTFRAE
jgi:hypothetical protein